MAAAARYCGTCNRCGCRGAARRRGDPARRAELVRDLQAYIFGAPPAEIPAVPPLSSQCFLASPHGGSLAYARAPGSGMEVRTRTAADTAFPEWEEMLEIPVMSPEDVITVCLVDECLEDMLTPPAVAAAEAAAAEKRAATGGKPKKSHRDGGARLSQGGRASPISLANKLARPPATPARRPLRGRRQPRQIKLLIRVQTDVK